MTSPARTVQVFGGYLLALGAFLVVAPNLLLGLFGVPPTSEVWIRVAGMLVAIIGYYYWRAASSGLDDFVAWTVPVRVFVLLCFAGFVILGLAPPVLVLFGAVDAAGAAWTLLAIRQAKARA